MATWHVTMGAWDGPKHPVCESPPAMRIVDTCSHNSRAAARRAARRINVEMDMDTRVVRGECPASVAVAQGKA